MEEHGIIRADPFLNKFSGYKIKCVDIIQKCGIATCDSLYQMPWLTQTNCTKKLNWQFFYGVAAGTITDESSTKVHGTTFKQPLAIIYTFSKSCWCFKYTNKSTWRYLETKFTNTSNFTHKFIPYFTLSALECYLSLFIMDCKGLKCNYCFHEKLLNIAKKY